MPKDRGASLYIAEIPEVNGPEVIIDTGHANTAITSSNIQGFLQSQFPRVEFGEKIPFKDSKYVYGITISDHFATLKGYLMVIQDRKNLLIYTLTIVAFDIDSSLGYEQRKSEFLDIIESFSID